MPSILFILTAPIFFLLSLLAIGPESVLSQTGDCVEGTEVNLDDYRWENRILITISDDRESHQFLEQKKLFSGLDNEFTERDLIVISLFYFDCSEVGERYMTDESADRLKRRLVDENAVSSFSVMVIGKDGGIKLRSEEVIEPDELFSVIDRMPMRQREMREGR